MTGLPLTLLQLGLVLALLIPIAAAAQPGRSLWETLAAFASLSTKAAVVMLLVSVLRDDWMLGLVGVIVLSVGNAGLLLLARLLREEGPWAG